MTAVLRLENVTLNAPVAGRPVALLRDVSFAVEAGGTFGLVGESGAGKSMIGRLLSGLLPPGFALADGRVLFGGDDLARLGPAARRALLGDRIAFIPQEPLSALNPVLTVERQFGDHLARRGLRGRAARARILEWLDAVHLPDPPALLRRYPHELSGGQCQRVLVAMAFSSEPRLIVADEPTTALDVVTQSRIVALLREQQGLHGAAVLLITHDLHLAAQVCDEVGVMYAGDMVERGPARAVLRDPLHAYTLGLRNSVPDIDGPRRVLPTLPDAMPGVSVLGGLPGCRFAPRCPARDAGCAAGLPPWQEIEPAHFVRCAPACRRAEYAPPADIVLTAAAPAASRPVLELSGVSLTYVTRVGLRRVAVEAVRNVSLAVGAREFVGLVGESGSGKSSVARLVMGLERPTSGTVTLDGADPRRDVRFVFQDPASALNPRRTVSSLLTQAFEAPGAGVGAEAWRARALALLRETGLPPDCLPRVPSQLSGGQKQRVNIARALCITPRLLVADEIVSGLDVSVQAQILNLLLRIGRELGIGVLLISHDLAVVRYACTRVAVMHRGAIVESGPTDAVFANPTHPYTRTLLDAVPSRQPGRAVQPMPHIASDGASPSGSGHT